MKEFSVKINGRQYSFEPAAPLDISVPMQFNGPQPNTYGVAAASAKAYEAGSFVGDTRRGGSCNFEEYRLVPHCNGTHTECVGHLALERLHVTSVLRQNLLAATLLTIAPQPHSEVHESCAPKAKNGDILMSRAALAEAIAGADRNFLEALIVRTSPNDAAKKERSYAEPPPPYFTTAAMALICELGVQHLLVDVPSVDRTLDDGKMTTHHLFWNVPQGSNQVEAGDHSMKTITEMIFVADSIADGFYLLDLQIPSFVADAAPSRPLLYELYP